MVGTDVGMTSERSVEGEIMMTLVFKCPEWFQVMTPTKTR